MWRSQTGLGQSTVDLSICSPRTHHCSCRAGLVLEEGPRPVLSACVPPRTLGGFPLRPLSSHWHTRQASTMFSEYACPRSYFTTSWWRRPETAFGRGSSIIPVQVYGSHSFKTRHARACSRSIHRSWAMLGPSNWEGLLRGQTGNILVPWPVRTSLHFMCLSCASFSVVCLCGTFPISV